MDKTHILAPVLTDNLIMNLRCIRLVAKLSSLSEAELKCVATLLELPEISEEECILEVISNAMEKGGDEVMETVENYIRGPPELEETNSKMEELELLKSQYEELAKKMESLTKGKPGDFDFIEPVSRFLSPIRDYKIQGNIGSPGEKGKLSYVSLIRQIELGIEKKYSEKEIVQAVIRSISPHLQFRSYLESMPDLKLPRLRKLLRSHYQEKKATELYTNLATMKQETNESHLDFVMRALDLRQKIIFSSKESESEISYEPSLVQALMLHTIQTGIANESIRAQIRPYLERKGVDDDEIIEKMTAIMSSEQERDQKFQNKQRKGGVHAVETQSESNKALLQTLESVKAEVASLRETVHKPPVSRYPEKSATRPRLCDYCFENNKTFCNHCYKCGSSSHIARGCRKQGWNDDRHKSENGQGHHYRD